MAVLSAPSARALCGLGAGGRPRARARARARAAGGRAGEARVTGPARPPGTRGTPSSGRPTAWTMAAVVLAAAPVDPGSTGSYVVSVAPACAAAGAPALVVAGTSSGAVAWYDLGGAKGLPRLGGGRHGLGPVAVAGGGPAAALSAGADGVVAAWDARASGPALKMDAGEPCTCVTALGEHWVVAGGGGRVMLWDARAGGRRAGAFDDTHDGDVTAVVGHPTQANVMASGGVDGLVAVWHVDGAVTDDAAFAAALNLNVSVDRLGFCGGNGDPELWATTGVEGVATWEWAEATDEASARGAGAAAALADARSAAAAASGGGAPADYMLGCVADGGRLLLAAGSHAGAVALLPVGGAASPGGEPLLGAPASILSGGHSATVRALAPLGRGRLATGGEDGRVVVWGEARTPPPATPAPPPKKAKT